MRLRATRVGALSTGGLRSLLSRTLAILAKFGADAHLWLPGAAIPVLGPELVVNGDGTSVTGWNLASSTVTSVNGEFVINASAQYAGMNQTVTLVTGARYILSARNRLGTAASAFTRIRQASGEAIVNLPNMTTTDTTSSIEFVAPDTDGFIELMTLAVGSGTFYADSISLRQVLSYSNHISGITAGNYLDSIGSDLLDGLTQVDQPVGLVLDATGALQANLTPNNINGFSHLYGGGTLLSDTQFSSVSAGGVQKDAMFTIGKTYRLEGSFTQPSPVEFSVNNFAGAKTNTVFQSNALAGTFSVVLTALAAELYLRLAGTSTVTISLSVREITGLPLTQPTTANKPILRRGYTNFALYSMDFANAAWSKTNMTAVGTLVSRSSTTLPCYTGNTTLFTVPIGSKLTIVARVSAGTLGGFFGLRFQGTYPNKIDMLINLATGAFTTAENAFVLNGAEVVEDGGAWLCVMRLTVASSIGARIYWGPTDGTVVTSSWEVATADLCNANLHGVARFDGHATAAQIVAAGGIPRTVASAVSTEKGDYSWQFDGSNDALLGAFNTTTTGLIVAGARPFISGAWAMMVSSGSQLSTNPGVRLGINGANKFTFGTASGAASVGCVPSVTVDLTKPSVVSGVWSPTLQRIRVEGVDYDEKASTVAASVAGMAVGSGRYAAGATADYFNGNIHSAILINGAVSAADILTLERFTAWLQGRTL